MRFAAMFFDDLTPTQLEPELTREHFDYLARHRDRITLAGGLRPPEGGRFCGTLWVIEAETPEDARRLMDEDPYCFAGLRPDRRLYFWNAAPVPAPKPAEQGQET
ncbi:YciI family protein [Paracoccus sp. S-4012]|uniref:YciI family protein n=1 Tax=Paracoccus sp. S-4012 TaxID=2665648 RepID=UPI0018A2209D|nr:YciI family protein [Paracoccus sp. S-4012]